MLLFRYSCSLRVPQVVAGNRHRGIFNLGQSNTVDATSALSGASVGTQLQVTNSGTGSGAQGIAAFNNSVAATLYGRNSGAGPAISGRADKRTTASRASRQAPVRVASTARTRARTAMGLPGAASGPGGSASGRKQHRRRAGRLRPIQRQQRRPGHQRKRIRKRRLRREHRASAATVSPGGARVGVDRRLRRQHRRRLGRLTTGGLHLGGQLDCSGCVGAGALAPGAGNRVGGYELVSASSVHDNLVRTERNIVVNCPPAKMVLGGGGWAQEGAADKEGGNRRQLTGPSITRPAGVTLSPTAGSSRARR